MIDSTRQVMAAALSQIVAQALTGWTLVAHVSGWPEVSIWVVVFLLAAGIVPFRHNGTLRDRAAGNFGASLVLSSFMWWEVLEGGLESIIGGVGFGLSLEAMLMLGATVLFAVAGGLFWLLREDRPA